MIKSTNIALGLDKYILDLDKIVENTNTFNLKWEEFYNSDKLNPNVFTKNGNTLKYLCDFMVPTKTDNRTPIFLLFGNSTPHSIHEKIYFPYEGNEREHRMWKLFEEFNLLNFNLDTDMDLRKKNAVRKQAIFDLSYISKFRVGMDVFFSIPSTPSRPPWAGVAGIQRLFGKKAIHKLNTFEQQRLKKRINTFLDNKGYIIAFQKDAYNGIVSKDSQRYSLNSAINGTLVGKYMYDENISVFGVAPTRWLNGGKAKETLKVLIAHLRI